VHVGESEKMAQRVLQIAADPQLREAFAQQDLSCYGAQAVAARICEILKQL